MGSVKVVAGTKQSVPGMPSKLQIFKVESSQYYWARVYFHGRYFTRSTKTTNKKQAYEQAKALYNEALLTDGLPNNPKSKPTTFSGVALALLEHEKATAKQSLYQNDRSRLNGLLIPFFKEQKVGEIDYSQLVGLLRLLNESERKFSPATKRHYLSLTRKVLKFAVDSGVLQTLPVFPKLTEKLQTQKKRDYLRVCEYRALNNQIKKMATEGVKVRGTLVTEEFRLINLFMINSFLRPSDIRVLKHKHVRVSKDKKTGKEWLVLSHPETKTTAREVQTMPNAVQYYQRLIELRGGLFINPDDYVFFPEYMNRQTAIGNWSRVFRQAVKNSGLQEQTGKNIQLYSLRHTAIMLRLIKGRVDTLVLAKNARTSQQVIESHYAAHLTSDQVVDQLHSFE